MRGCGNEREIIECQETEEGNEGGRVSEESKGGKRVRDMKEEE